MTTWRSQRNPRSDVEDGEFEVGMEPRLQPDAGRISDRGRRRAGEGSPQTLLPLYLREMGANRLIDEQREVELARQLQEARRAMARLAKGLPAECRRYTLEGNPSGPDRPDEWSLDHIETFHRNLELYAGTRSERRIAVKLEEASRLKRRLDEARDAMILANLRLVVHIAKKYVNNGIPFMDLIQEGNIGLMRAVEKFEYERGNKFSTYAFWWIKQAVERAIADKARIIRIPVHVNEKLKKVRRATRELTESLGRRPTPREIGRRLRMPVEKVEEVQAVVPDAQAFEELDSDTTGLDVLQRIPDQDAPSPLEWTSDHERRALIEASLRRLAPREEEILRLRFGIGREMARTLEDIGRVLGLSRERVRQIEAIALGKIKASDESRDLRALLA